MNAEMTTATKFPELPDRVMQGTAHAVAWKNIDRAIAALELIADAGRDKDGFGDAVATTIDAVNEWLVQVMQIIDAAPEAEARA